MNLIIERKSNLELINNYFLYRQKRNKNFIQRIYNDKFLDTPIQELSKKEILSILDYYCKNDDIRIVNEFINLIIYFSENNLFFETTLNHLNLIFKNNNMRRRFKEVKYFLEKDDIEIYLDSGLINPNKNTSYFFVSCDINKFIDINVFSYVDKFFNCLKKNKEISNNQKKEILFYFKTNYVPLLFNKEIEEINYQFFKTIFCNLPKNSMPTYIFNFLVFGIEEEILHDPDFKKLTHLKNSCLNYSAKRKTLKKIFQSENPQNFRFLLNPYNKKCLYYLDIDFNEDLIDVIQSFINNLNSFRLREIKIFFENFSTSIGYKIHSINQLNYNTFKRQINYFKKFADQSIIHQIILFYLYIYKKYNHSLFSESNFDINILTRSTISRELFNNYKFVAYNPFDPIPKHDKWLLYFKGFEMSNVSISKTSTKAINFDKFNVFQLKEFAKYFIWHSNISILTRIRIINSWKYFNIFYEKFYISKAPNHESKDGFYLSNDIILNYIQYLKINFSKIQTVYMHIDYFRNILILLDSHQKIKTDIGYKELLSTRNLKNSQYKNSIISDEKILKLINYIKEKSKKDSKHVLYLTIFLFLIESNFRISQITILKINCIKKSPIKNEYLIKSNSKTSGNEVLESPISIYLKRQVERVIKITNSYRDQCYQENIKDFLFLIPSFQPGIYKFISSRDFSVYLKNCCRKLEIDPITSGELRNTYMTKVQSYIIKNSLSPMNQKVLTGHQSPLTTLKHYINIETRTLLEAVHGVIIGNVNVEGKVIEKLPKHINLNNDLVCNKCGYCNSEFCNNYTYVDCLLCKNFVTTIDRYPFFSEQIKIINHNINSKSIVHDIEDQINIKRLLLYYMSEIMAMRNMNANSN